MRSNEGGSQYLGGNMGSADRTEEKTIAMLIQMMVTSMMVVVSMLLIMKVMIIIDTDFDDVSGTLQ